MIYNLTERRGLEDEEKEEERENRNEWKCVFMCKKNQWGWVGMEIIDAETPSKERTCKVRRERERKAAAFSFSSQERKLVGEVVAFIEVVAAEVLAAVVAIAAGVIVVVVAVELSEIIMVNAVAV